MKYSYIKQITLSAEDSSYFNKTERYIFHSGNWCCIDIQNCNSIKFNEYTGRIELEPKCDWDDFLPLQYCPFCGEKFEGELVKVKTRRAKIVEKITKETIYEDVE